MFSSLFLGMDKVGEAILTATIPHHKNNHRPHLIKGEGLFLLLFVLLASQITVNFLTRSGDLLGYATNISSSVIISLTNSERKNAGLHVLSEKTPLDSAATLKAKDMFQKDYWAHYAPDGTSPWYFFGLVGYQYAAAGENLARDFATSEGVVNAWMDSPGHRANILNSSFTEIGVGVVNGNLQGEDTTLVVQLFGKPLQTASGAVGSSVQGSSGTPTKVEAGITLPNVEQEENPEVVTPKSEGLGTQTAQKKANDITALVKNTTDSQRVTIILLLLVGILFITDSFVIFRKRHVREGSHSFAHASIIILLAVSSLLYGWGTIL